MRHTLLLLIVFCGVTSAAQQRPTLHDFDKLTTFRCDFTESEGRRTSAAGATTPARREIFSDLVIDALDYRKKTARFIGNAGSDTVTLLDGSHTISFIESNTFGNVNVLSIFKKTGSVTTYKAAYSRHSALTTGDLTVSQSYGTCRGLL